MLFALSYCTTKDSFSTQYHPQVLGSVFDFSRNHRQELILKIWHLISVLCSILRSIIYALSEPQMGLGKSRRKNLRPSFQKLFPSFNTIFFLMMLIRKWKCLLGSNFVPNYFFTLFCCTFNGKSLEKKCLKSYLFMNLKLVFVVKMCFI